MAQRCSVNQVQPNEATRLIQHPKPQPRKRLSLLLENSPLSPKRVCLSSRAVILIFMWTVVIGAIYEGASIISGTAIQGLHNIGVTLHSPAYIILGVYLLLAIVNMFYPLSGFLADVWCGRYRTVVISLICLWFCLLMATILATIDNASAPGEHPYGVEWAIAGLAFALFVPALAGFTSNVVQLGFDQLLDAPSYSLGTFVHWFVWTENVGVAIIYILHAVEECSRGNSHIGQAMIILFEFSPAGTLIILSISLIVAIFMYRHFYIERARKNPYKLIVQILNFTRKHKYPVRPPSAFVYTYHRKPCRMDYAKEVYGGPFINADVDDVKTFLRILLLLFAVGPIFILQVPMSHVIFPIFSLNTGETRLFDNSTCTAKWIILESGTLSTLTALCFLPIYIWLIYSVLRNRIPKILTRLAVASILLLFAVISMPVIDLIGHIVLHSKNSSNGTVCMFLEPIYGPYNTLNLHWAVLLLPNILSGIAPHILLATALEFISAQGPHTMKGVLVGLLFAIKGFYQLLGASLVFPFGMHQIWKNNPLEVASFLSCEFLYFIALLCIALVGLICFVVCACKYEYRIRGEEGFSQSDVEEVFERRLQQEEEYMRRNGQQELLGVSEQSNDSFQHRLDV